ALVATFPQLEYPRAWPAHVHVVGPLMWEPPVVDGVSRVARPAAGTGVGAGGGVVDARRGTQHARKASANGEAGEAPLVLVAPSTAQDPEHRLLHAALRGLAGAPVRVLATYNRRLPPRPLPVPDNATVVE